MKKIVACAAVSCLVVVGVAAGAQRAARGQGFLANVNDQMIMKGSKILCAVASAPGGNVLTCYKAKDARHIAVGTYGVGISDKGVVVIRLVSDTKRKVVFRRNN